jgi:hypothetical protein
LPSPSKSFRTAFVSNEAGSELVTVKFAVLLGALGTDETSVVTPEVVFGCVPTVLLVTGKRTVQGAPLAGITMPVKFTIVAFAGIVTVANDAHVPLVPPPTAVIFVSVSENAPSTPNGSVFVNVSSTVEVPPDTIESGMKLFAIVVVVGAFTVNVAVLLAAPAVGVTLVVTPEVAFVCAPTTLPRTANCTIQLPFDGKATPLIFTFVAPAGRLIGASNAQLPLTAPPAVTRFVNVSLNAATMPNGLGLVIVAVTTDVPPAVIIIGLNALAIVGAP